MRHDTTGKFARTGRWFTVALVAIASLVTPSLVTSATAAVGAGDDVWIGGKVGYGGTSLAAVYETPPADPNAPGDPDYWAYCIEHNIPAETHIDADVDDPSNFLGSNYFTDPAIQAKVVWVLAHSYPAMSLADFGTAAGVPGISLNDAIEATQYAIWRYTDLTWDAAWSWETDDSKDAYYYLINGANASPGMTLADVSPSVSVVGPSTAGVADSLVGPFTVSTNQPKVGVSVTPGIAVTDASGATIDVNAVIDGQEIYLDLRGTTAAGSATVTVAAAGSSATGKIVSVPTTPGTTPTTADHAQSIILVTPDTTKVTADASAQWAGVLPAATPVIGTTLVDAADGDKILPWNGGTVTDTVTYQYLVPGREYTLVGELMRKSDGSGTGVTGSATFTPSTASGQVEVNFTVPDGLAGTTLVAFEYLHEGRDTSTAPVAEHADLNDAAQTVTVEAAPGAAGSNASGPHHDLPTTGLSLPGWSLIAALAALAAGAVLMRAGRRRMFSIISN